MYSRNIHIHKHINIDSTIVNWGDGNTDTTTTYAPIQHVYNTPGLWDIIVSTISDYGCMYSDTLYTLVETTQPPTAQFIIQPNPTTIYNTHITCDDWSTGVPVQWQWSAPDAIPMSSTQQDSWFTFPEEAGEYYITLTVTDANSCWDTITHKFIVEHEMLIFVPNSFTPGGADEFNNVFKWTALGIDESQFQLFIYNRWGELIWETKDPYSTWDGTYKGKLVPDGAYVWSITAKNKLDSYKKLFMGSITIIR
jgi:gliding motility-associated-like protein